MLTRLALVALVTSGAAWLQPGAAKRVVLRQGRGQALPGVPSGAVSADGRHVAFVSSSRLLPSDTNGVEDIYVLDRRTQRLTLETLASDGRAADGSALHPHLRADGRYIVFDSMATGMTGVDRNGCIDVFLRDRLLGKLSRISVGLDANEANDSSAWPAVADDGHLVAFESHATNLVAGPDENGTAADVYVASLPGGAIARAGVDRDGRQFGQSHVARLSGDGRYVVFVGRPRHPAPEHHDAPALGYSSIYLRDLAAGTTNCVSCDRAGRPGLPAFAPDISADGSVVVFAVQTAPRRSDVVVHDRADGSSLVVTRRANAGGAAPRLSRDGRTVVFESLASDLLCEGRCTPETVDENLLPDIYLYDRVPGTFRRASGARGSWWAPSVAPAIGGRGQVVVFSSREPFGPEDVTADFDLFVCEPVCP